jgi:catechol 2,3-dioxygenase-like lactoylglutathione lyase family enzyme
LPSTETHQGAHLLATSACFVVEDVFSSAEYYRDTLGFSFDTFFGDPPSFVMLRRDGIVVMLKQLPGATSQAADVGPPAFLDAYFWVDDLDALADELRQRGADFAVGPTERPIYHGRDLYIRDCDGRVLCFGQVSGA